MFSLSLKTLLFVWPFLKRAIFGDRTVKEVLLENKHVTLMLILIVILAFMLAAVTMELRSVRDQHSAVRTEVQRIKEASSPEEAEMLIRRDRLNTLLKQ